MKEQLAVDVQSIYSTDKAFAALKDDGSVVAWGPSDLGGDCSAVQDQLNSGVASLCSTDYSKFHDQHS